MIGNSLTHYRITVKLGEGGMVVYPGLGEKEKALEQLEKSYADRDPQCWPLKVEPFYDSLRTEPRFQALLKKVGLDK